jgi:hypothetical protein
VAALPNDDVAVAGSDAVIRIFTKNPLRMAPAEVKAVFSIFID